MQFGQAEIYQPFWFNYLQGYTFFYLVSKDMKFRSIFVYCILKKVMYIRTLQTIENPKTGIYLKTDRLNNSYLKDKVKYCRW